MKDRDFYIKPNRETVVTRSDLSELHQGDLGRPRAEDLNHERDFELLQCVLNGSVIWLLRIFSRTGFDQEQSNWRFFASELSAKAAKERFPLGTEIDPLEAFKPISRDFDAENLSLETTVSILGRGEPPYGLVYDVLQGAQVLGRDNRLSSQVLTWLGAEGQNTLSERFGQNWSCVAALEYCVKHFHSTSLATLAARVQVADFVAPHDYDAGFASRELQQAYGGAEIVASEYLNARKAAGAAGGRASSERRYANLELLIDEIEKLAGAVDLISEDRIVEQALEAARHREPRFPTTKRSLDDYGTALRSEEPFKSRYEAVFRRNA